jgi:hypothetical protein
VAALIARRCLLRKEKQPPTADFFEQLPGGNESFL